MLVGLSRVCRGCGLFYVAFVSSSKHLLTDCVITCIEFRGFTRCTNLDIVRRIILTHGRVALGHVGTLSLVCLLHGLETESRASGQDVRSPGLPWESDLREPLRKTGVLKGGKDVDDEAGTEVEGEGKACVLPPEALDLPFGKCWGPPQAKYLSCFRTCTVCVLPEALSSLYVLLLTDVHPGWSPTRHSSAPK